MVAEVLLYHWYVNCPPPPVLNAATFSAVIVPFKHTVCGFVEGCVVINGAVVAEIVIAPEITLVSLGVQVPLTTQ